MKIIFFLFSFFIFITPLYAQWSIINEGLPDAPERIYFTDIDNGFLINSDFVLITENGGETWRNITLPEKRDLTIIKMASNSVGWAIPEDGTTDIYKTENGGLNWNLLYSISDPYPFYNGDVLNDSVLCIIGSDYIIETNDGGKNWRRYRDLFRRHYYIEAKISSPQTTIVLGRLFHYDSNLNEVSILRTADGGKLWEEVILNELKDNDYVWDLQYLNGSTAFFLASKKSNYTKEGFLYSSVDSGKTWNVVLEWENILTYHFLDAKTGYCIVQDSTGNKLMKSIDGGNNWEKIASDISGKKIQFVNQDTGFLLDGDDVWKTDDGGKNWTRIVFTYPFKDVNFIDSNNGFTCGGLRFGHGGFGDLFFTNDGGQTWSQRLHFDGRGGEEIGSCDFFGEDLGFSVTNASIYKTTDLGEHWLEVYNPFYSTTYGFNGKDIVIQNSQNIYAAGRADWSLDSSGTAILSSTDSGETWDLIWKYPDTEEYDYSLFSINIVNTTIWAVGERGLIVKFVSPDSFRVSNTETDLPLNDVYFSDENHGWIAGGYYDDLYFESVLLKTRDAGQKWDQISFNKYLINDIYFADSLHGWAVGQDTSTHGMVLETFDGGENWDPVVENLSASLNAIHFKDGYGWAVGENGLILKTDDINWIDQSTGKTYPEKIVLHKNYPNPFNPTTTIEYQLPKTSQVELSIYNLLGQKIATLVNKKQAAGSYQVEWDGSGFASGVYIYKISTDQGFSYSKKLLLIR